MFVRLIFSLSLAVLMSSCGSDTSWYVCSGSAEFCRIDPPDEEDDKPVTIGAVEISRSTPQPIEAGLPADGLEELLDQAPELVAGWLIAGSLGLLVDDSDNAAASRFLDNNRYWLALNEEREVTDDRLLAAGLRLLKLVAESRDPDVADAAAGIAAKMVTLSGAESSEPPPTDQTEQVIAQASDLVSGYSPDSCCSVDELMATAVLLCESAQLPAADAVADACAVANRWLREESP